MTTDRWVTVDGHRIRYYEAGEGPTLLLLHGGIIDAAPVSWGAVLEPLAERFHVVAPDLLGYGDSDVPDVTYTLDRHVETMAGFVETLGLTDLSVVGLSMGGAIGLGVTLDTDVPVRRLALVDSYGLGSDLPNGTLSWVLARVQLFNRLAIALFARSRRLTRAGLGGIVADVDSLSPEAVDSVWRYAKYPHAGVPFRSFRAHEVTRKGYRTDFTPRLGDVSVPTLLIHGAHDEVVPVEWAERAADRIPDARLAVLEDCAHWPPREAPDDVVDRLEAFVAGTTT